MRRTAQQPMTWQSARLGQQQQQQQQQQEQQQQQQQQRGGKRARAAKAPAAAAGETGACSDSGTLHLVSLPVELLSEVMLQLGPADALAACTSCRTLRDVLADAHTMAKWLVKHRPNSEFRAASSLAPMRTYGVFRCLHEQLHLDVHKRDAHRQLPLHYACERGLAVQAQWLIQMSSESELKRLSSEQLTPLQLASRAGHACVVEMLLQQCSRDSLQPNFQDSKGRTALHMLCQHGHTSTVDLLLGDKGPDHKLRDRGGRIAQHLAAAAGDADVLSTFVRHPRTRDCSSMYSWDSSGRTVLMLAVRSGSLPAVRTLLQHPSHRFQCDNLVFMSGTGRTPIMEACFTDNMGMARELLQHMSDFGCKNQTKYGSFVMHVASHYGAERCVGLLLSDAKTSWQALALNDRGELPLHLACRAASAGPGHVGVVRHLLGFKGMVPDARARGSALESFVLGLKGGLNARVGEQCFSPLHLACQQDGKANDEIVRVLLQQPGMQVGVLEGEAVNGGVHARDSAGMTALHWACQQGVKGAVRQLLQAGASMQRKDDAGRTPQQLATLRKREGRVHTAEEGIGVR